IGEVLNAQVDREDEVTSRAGRPDALDVLHDPAIAVLDHPLLAIDPGQPLVVCQLESRLTLIVDVGEADQLPGDFARRIITAVLAREIHTGDVERLDPVRLRGLALAGDIKEVAVEIARDAAQQLLGADAERTREPRDLTARARDLLRVDPDRVDGRAHRERLAVAVGDGSAVRRDVDDAREAGITLLR